jgi:DNA-binding transcriptional LysR family regulator
VETGQVWPSAVAAARELHVSQAAITLAMRQARPVRVLAMTFEALREVA